MDPYIKIIQGTDRTLSLVLKNSDGTPFDLTFASAIKAIFQKQDDSENLLEVTMAGGGISIVGEGSRGEISINLAASVTSQMRLGTRLTWEVEITRSSRKYVAQFPELLDVLARLSA